MNEILYNQKNFLKSQENFLLKLAPYMLSHDVWEKIKAENKDVIIHASSSSSSSSDSPFPSPPPPIKTFFQSNLRDSIFWCIYVAINGESCFQSQLKSGVNMINLMMNEKKAISDYFNNNLSALKNSNHKITLAKINEIKCNLMTKSCMDSIDNFIPCSIYYKRPIYVYFEEIHSYMLFVDKNYVDNDDDTEGDDILLSIKDGRFVLESNVAEFIKNKCNLFHIQHYEKILAGISTYKTNEVQEIYKTIFGKDDGLKKTEYYEKILVKCSAIVNAKI
jgi:hypothetical protein